MQLDSLLPRAAIASTNYAEYSPGVVIDTLAIPGGCVHVVRDDLLAGGTKQRAAIPYLASELVRGYREFVYASPFCGFAQVALAAACRELDAYCTLFCEVDRADSDGRRLHEFSLLAKAAGARIVAIETLAEAESRAALYAAADPQRRKLPLGFDCDEFRAELLASLTRQWGAIEGKYGLSPRSVWLPLGSGTLSTTFRQLLPPRVALKCVNIRILDPNDTRLIRLRETDGVEIFTAPEAFVEPSRTQPPFPSNLHYDAKLWSFIEAHAQDGDLLWNVAR